MKFPVGTLIATRNFPLQVCEVLGYSEGGTEFYVNIIRDGNGDKYVDVDLDVALEFEEDN